MFPRSVCSISETFPWGVEIIPEMFPESLCHCPETFPRLTLYAFLIINKTLSRLTPRTTSTVFLTWLDAMLVLCLWNVSATRCRGTCAYTPLQCVTCITKTALNSSVFYVCDNRPLLHVRRQDGAKRVLEPWQIKQATFSKIATTRIEESPLLPSTLFGRSYVSPANVLGKVTGYSGAIEKYEVTLVVGPPSSPTVEYLTGVKSIEGINAHSKPT